jgi:N-acyl-D-amino-acid deacylase
VIAVLLAGTVVPSTLIAGGTVIDGTGVAGRLVDVRIRGSQIVEIGKLRPKDNEKVISAKGMVVCPGFIDAHSHADFGLAKDPGLVSQLSQGITTAIVGQDGIWSEPVGDLFRRLAKSRPAMNFAAFSGAGGIRAKVMGADFKRAATWNEITKMAHLVGNDMDAGALGVSSGLEYDPGYYSDTEELTALAKVAGSFDGVYISHVRDEGNKAFTSFRELLEIAKSSGARGQVSHIKLCAAGVWGQGAAASTFLTANSLTADVYPYLFWQSTIAALTPSREWEKREIWVTALKDVGGAKNVRLTSYTPNPRWVGKTIAQIGADTKRDPISVIQEILEKTRDGKGDESVAVSAMREDDLTSFIRSPQVMFSSDGSPGGSHPRSAGSFPRVLGHYVRDRKVVSLQEAVRKMTWLPAQTFRLRSRGRLSQGYVADVVVFDPKTISDRATAQNPTALSVGVKCVLVSGSVAYANGKVTGSRTGQMVRRGK